MGSSEELEEDEENKKENGKKKNGRKNEEKSVEKAKQKIEEEGKRMAEMLTSTTTKMPVEEKNEGEKLCFKLSLVRN